MSHALHARRRARFLGTLAAFGLARAGTERRRELGRPERRYARDSRDHGLVEPRRPDLGRRRARRHRSRYADASAVKVTLNGNDVTSAFAVRENGRYEGLVTGLRVGKNVLVARPAPRRHHGKRKHENEIVIGRQITIRNHPIGGPVFAGPQVTPFFCNPNASNPPLGAAIDAQCNAPTKVEFLYRNTATPAQFVAYDPASPPPAALIAQTTTDAGKTVPFIVQRVTGTADRGIYQIAVLVDPSKPIEPWSTTQPWSHKLFYTFGGACGNQHTQTAPGNVLQATQLGLGFAVATSSLNIYANNCNDLVSAEATTMTKEIVIERYGQLLYTVGNGGSAASMQQHLLAENYPGLLDGMTTSQVFPDHMGQVLGSLDCRLLYHYFWPTSPLRFRGTRQRRRTRSSRRRSRGSRCSAATPRTRTTSAVRRSSRSAPTGPSSCPHPESPAGCRRADLEPVQSDRGALRNIRLPALRLRRSDHSRRTEREGPERDRQRRRPVRAERLTGGTDHGRAVRRPEREGRRHRHRRQLHARAEGRRPGRAGDSLQHRPHEQRLGRRGHPGDRQPHRLPDGRHRLPPGVRDVRVPRAARSVERTPRQSDRVAVAPRRRRPVAVRLHAAVARQPLGRHQHDPQSVKVRRAKPADLSIPASWQTASRAT